MKIHTKTSSMPAGCLRSIGRFTLAALACLALAGAARAQTYTLGNAWTQLSVSGGDATNNLDTANDNRGLCYGAVSNQVLVNNKGTHVITSYDGNSGVSNGVVNMTGVSLGNFTINKLGFGTDGILYGANLETAVPGTAPYKIYSWTNQTDAPYNCYATTASDAIGTFTAASGNKRFGDSFAITGGGTNTLMLAGTDNTTNLLALFYTTDGVNFTPTLVNVPLPTPGSGVQFGFCFYTNNTFLMSPNPGGSLYLVQFPANYETASSPLTATVLATSSFTGEFLDLSYNASAGLLAAHPNASAAIDLYTLPSTNFSAFALAVSTNLSFATSESVNGNETGEIALGGQGLTNMIYTLDTSAGVQATAILFTPAPPAPAITVEPVGNTVYAALGTYTFTVSASGVAPMTYAWQYNTESNLDTAADIPNATNDSYTISPLTTNATGWYDVIVTDAGGSVTSAPVNLTVMAPASSLDVTSLWSLPPGTAAYPFLDSTSYDTLGLAYDPKSQTVLVASAGADFGIFALNANTGANLFTMNTAGIGEPGDYYDLDQIGTGDDGVLYACNCMPGGSGVPFQLISWSSINSNAAPYQAFLGDPGNGSGDRWGDTMAVRGAGTNTEILLGSFYFANNLYGSGPGTNAALLTTTDGSNFLATTLSITNAGGIPAGFCRLGIAFGAGNTFWGKNPGYNDLWQIGFDPTTGNCTILQDITGPQNGTADWWGMCGITLDAAHNLLAGLGFYDVPNNLYLFQLSTNALPYLFDQAFFSSLNGNIQDNGVTIMKYPRIYALDVNNGIIALSYIVPTNPPAVTQAPVSVTNYVGLTAVFSVTVTGTPPLSYQWQKNGTILTGQTGSTLTLSPLNLAMTGDYSVVVTNAVGTNRATASLTVLADPAAIDLSSDLVLHLKFNDNCLDYSGRGNNGTNMGVTFVTNGILGQAAHFTTEFDSGIFNYVMLGLLPDLEFSSNIDFSLACWVRMPAGEQPGDVPFIGNAVGAGDSPGYFFGPTYGTGGWRWTLWNGDGSGSAVMAIGPANSINDGKWHHFAATFSRTGNGVTFLDGLQVSSVPISSIGDLDTGQPTVVGQDPTGVYDDYLDDTVQYDLDDMGVWRRALSPLEVEAMYVVALSNQVSFVSAPVDSSRFIVGRDQAFRRRRGCESGSL